MRKILAVVLTVLMLASVLAALPVSAAYSPAKADSPNKLIITEFGAGMDAEGTSGSKVLHYMEVLNVSGEEIDMTKVAIARATDYIRKPKANEDIHYTTDEDENYKTWNEYKFLAKILISSTVIVDETPYIAADKFAAGYTYDADYGLKLTNENAETELANGETAIIWFIGQETMTWLEAQKGEVGVTDYDPVQCFLEQFYPGDENEAKRAALAPHVLMVWAYDNEALDSTPTAKKVNYNTFKIDVPKTAAQADARSYVYGLVDKDFAVGETAEKAYLTTTGWDARVYALARYGAALEDMYTGETNTNLYSASYLPSEYDPFLYEAREKFMGDTVDYTDYVAAGLAKNYRECALVDMAKDRTPGFLTDWQWSYVDATKLASGSTADGVRKAFIDLFGYNDDDTLADGGREEPTIVVKPPSKEELMDRYFPADGGKKDDEGFPTWALVLIIVGGSVLVLGGAFVVVLFVVILPKKRAAAAAAVEESYEDAPAAEDVPAEEEAPVEEENKE